MGTSRSIGQGDSAGGGFPNPELDEAPAVFGAPQKAVLAGGCFWCTEAVFKRLAGVLEVRPGYAGGSAETANYKKVASGASNHAESIEVRFDPARISYGQLLKVFFSVAHDPTQIDRQGPDAGPGYRSAVFYCDEPQKRTAEAYIEQLNKAGVFDAPIATTVQALPAFYPAEEYHHDYADRNPGQPYIVFNARPKVEKLAACYPQLTRDSGD